MNSQKKILHISHSLDTGGGPLYIKKIAEDITGFSHYVAGNRGYFFNVIEAILGQQKVVALMGKNIVANLFIIQKIIRRECIGIIHCHGRGAGIYGRVVRIFNSRLKVVYTVHGFHPETVSLPVRKVYLWIERLLSSITNRIILVSATEQERFIQNIGDLQTKLVLIPNYLKLSELRPRALEFSLDSSYTNLIYIGRFAPEKGIDILISTMILLKSEPIRLYMIGYGAMESWIIKQVKIHSLEPNIILLGKKNEASNYLPNFDCTVVPSRYEGMPFIILEAMLYKIPIVATPAVGICDLINDQTSFMSSGFSPEDLSKSIVKFVTVKKHDTHAIAQMINSNQTNLIENYSEGNIAKLAALYKNL